MKKESKLKKRISRYLKKEQLLKNEEYEKLERSFLAKVRKNMGVANLLFKISEQEEVKKNLNLSNEFETYDWVIVVSYYAMYSAGLAAIAKLGFKSKSHSATIAVLEHYYVQESKDLEKGQIDKLANAYTLSKEWITKLLEIKTKRETAQYEATPAIARENATTALKDAEEFITKIEEITLK